MVCSGLDVLTEDSLVGLLQFPTTCDYYFYAKIMFAFFMIVALSLFFADRKRIVKADFISCLGISGISTIFVSLIGTLLEIIQGDVFIEIVVACLVFIVIWLVKRD